MTGGRGGGRGGRGIGKGMGRGRGRGTRMGRDRRAGQWMGCNPHFGPGPAGTPFGASAGTDQKILQSLAEALDNVVHAIRTPFAYAEAAKTKPSAPGDRNQETASEKSLRRIAVINEEMCAGCGICADNCPEHAVVFRNTNPVINPDRCSGCGVCVEQCPSEAISLSELTLATGT